MQDSENENFGKVLEDQDLVAVRSGASLVESLSTGKQVKVTAEWISGSNSAVDGGGALQEGDAFFKRSRFTLYANVKFDAAHMPNLIMASAFAMLFFTLFSNSETGPINSILLKLGIVAEPVRWLSNVWTARGLVGLMNFLMWFGNTTIILMAAIMGVDPGLYEAAQLDGASSTTMFWRITIPLIRPLLVYTLITSLIGGLQMFDVPQVLTNGKGDPNGSTNTIIMYLNQHLYSKNYGTAGAISVLMFLLCAVLCVIIYFTLTQEDDGLTREQRKAEKARIKAAKAAAKHH